MVQGDSTPLLDDSKNTHKTRRFCRLIQKADSYPTCGGESGCRATWSECGGTAEILSAEEENTAEGAVQVAEV